MKFNVKTDYLRISLLVIMVSAGLVCSRSAAISGVGLPLEVRLDLAKSVVVGKVTRIVKDDAVKSSGLEWGTAIIEVSKVLKGATAKSIEMKCVTSVAPNYGGSGAVYTTRTGESGIWVINADGYQDMVSPPSVLLKERKSDVIRILKQLTRRKWSEPVDGLRAWATVVPPGKYGNPAVIFAVQNVSRTDIFVPGEETEGFISADAKSKTTEYYLQLDAKPTGSGVFCKKVSPKEIIYLHPGYSAIDLRWKQSLPVGKYLVDITCENDQTVGYVWQSSRQQNVKAWTGKLTAPTVKLIVNSQEPIGTPLIMK